MAGVVGIEPTDEGFRVPCLTAWLHPNVAVICFNQLKLADLHRQSIAKALTSFNCDCLVREKSIQWL